ncbi:MAG TPA: glycogen/starch synthase [Chloroflexia bacterium]|nr:glycogen/starch synthase [Chloroflexia bacterium]
MTGESSTSDQRTMDSQQDNKSNRLKILIVAAEAAPFAKVGHVAEVVGSLPLALSSLGHDVRLVMPRYGRIEPAKFDLKPVAALQNLEIQVNRGTEKVYISEGKISYNGDSVPVYFVNNERYFNRDGIYSYPDDDERFILFCRAALEMLPELEWQPDIIHCHDWHTAIIPNWLKTVYADDPFYKNIASVFTIHNLAFQGIFGYRVLEVAGIGEYGFVYPEADDPSSMVNLMSLGIRFADAVSTVSPTYAQEILRPEFGEHMDRLLNERKEHLFGILNGIDVNHFNPAADRFLAANFDESSLEQRVQNKLDLQREAGLPLNPDVPVIGMISRLANQKGFDLIAQIIDLLMQLDLQFVLMGTGDHLYHDLFRQMHERYPEKAAYFMTFNTPIAQKIYGGSDIFLMPSRSEPCGLGQMIAMRYGSIPVVRQTGGLADTVKDFNPRTNTGNGFTFTDYDSMLLYGAIVRALETYKYPEVWRKLMWRDMTADYSWRASAAQYVRLYHDALKFHQEGQV